MKKIFVLILISVVTYAKPFDIREVVIFSCLMQNGVKLTDKLADISTAQQAAIQTCVGSSQYHGRCPQQGLFSTPACSGCLGCPNRNACPEEWDKCVYTTAENQWVTNQLQKGLTVADTFSDLLQKIGDNVLYCLQQNNTNSLIDFIKASNISSISYNNTEASNNTAKYTGILSCLQTHNIPPGLTSTGMCNQQGLFPTVDPNNNGLLQFQPAACQACGTDLGCCSIYAPVNETYQKNFIGSDQIAYKAYQCLLKIVTGNGTYGDVLANTSQITECMQTGTGMCIAQALFNMWAECSSCCGLGGYNFINACVVACNIYTQILSKVRAQMQYLGKTVNQVFTNCQPGSCAAPDSLTEQELDQQADNWTTLADKLGDIWEIINGDYRVAKLFHMKAQYTQNELALTNKDTLQKVSSLSCSNQNLCTGKGQSYADPDCEKCMQNANANICPYISALTFFFMPKSFKTELCSSCSSNTSTSSAVASGALAQANRDMINHYCSNADFQYYVDSQVYQYIYGSSHDDQEIMVKKDIIPIFNTYFYPEQAVSNNLYNIFNLVYLAFSDNVLSLTELKNQYSERFIDYILPIFHTSDIKQICDKDFSYALDKCLKASNTNQKTACLLCSDGDCIDKVLTVAYSSNVLGYLINTTPTQNPIHGGI